MILSPSTRIKIRKFSPDYLLDYYFSIRGYRRSHGVFPHLINPKTFNEKVLHRMLFDRRKIFTQMADKAAVRSYVKERLGPDILPRLYHLTSHPETIPFDELPDRFVIKPTHGSGWIKIIREKSRIDRVEIVQTCAQWLRQSYYEMTREWVYKNIEPRILVEEYIDAKDGVSPDDYKFFVFDGIVEMIQFDTGRFTDHRRRLYTPKWEKLDVRLEFQDIDAEMPPPPHLGSMIAAAEALGKEVDFVRADFYDTADRIYFGELTTTPGCAGDRFYPSKFDGCLGTHWKLKR